MTLEIKDLSVEIEGKEILKGVNLSFEKGKIYALMGPNGSGKSTLANSIMGNPKYKITKGNIVLDEADITDSKVDERAKKGLFMSFQTPVEIPGIRLINFLRTAYDSKFGKINPADFLKLMKENMEKLNIDKSFLKRELNAGFSGGEKKKTEILQMSILKPKYMILDEIDSGLDVDALKIIANGIKQLRSKDNSFIIITHYNKLLEYIQPDFIYILVNGKIVKKGGPELVREIEEEGFKKYNG